MLLLSFCNHLAKALEKDSINQKLRITLQCHVFVTILPCFHKRFHQPRQHIRIARMLLALSCKLVTKESIMWTNALYGIACYLFVSSCKRATKIIAMIKMWVLFMRIMITTGTYECESYYKLESNLSTCNHIHSHSTLCTDAAYTTTGSLYAVL